MRAGEGRELCNTVKGRRVGDQLGSEAVRKEGQE